jgi:hypothetical protein
LRCNDRDRDARGGTGNVSIVVVDDATGSIVAGHPLSRTDWARYMNGRPYKPACR